MKAHLKNIKDLLDNHHSNHQKQDSKENSLFNRFQNSIKKKKKLLFLLDL